MVLILRIKGWSREFTSLEPGKNRVHVLTKIMRQNSHCFISMARSRRWPGMSLGSADQRVRYPVTLKRAGGPSTWRQSCQGSPAALSLSPCQECKWRRCENDVSSSDYCQTASAKLAKQTTLLNNFPVLDPQKTQKATSLLWFMTHFIVMVLYNIRQLKQQMQEWIL